VFSSFPVIIMMSYQDEGQTIVRAALHEWRLARSPAQMATFILLHLMALSLASACGGD
jgi:hypothetical protein